MTGIQGDNNLIGLSKNESKENIIKHFNEIIKNEEIGILIICEYVTNKIEKEIKNHKKALTVIIPIPSKIQ